MVDWPIYACSNPHRKATKCLLDITFGSFVRLLANGAQNQTPYQYPFGSQNVPDFVYFNCFGNNYITKGLKLIFQLLAGLGADVPS